MAIEKEYPPPPTPREIKFLSEIERLRTDREKWKEDWLRLQTQVNEQGEEIERLRTEKASTLKTQDLMANEIERLNAYVEEWKIRYETARLAHEEGREEIERLRREWTDSIVRLQRLQNDYDVMAARLQHRIVTLEGMLGEANIAIPE